MRDISKSHITSRRLHVPLEPKRRLCLFVPSSCAAAHAAAEGKQANKQPRTRLSPQCATGRQAGALILPDGDMPPLFPAGWASIKEMQPGAEPWGPFASEVTWR
jgi:hypothetical protein